MTASRDPDRLIHQFVLEGEEQLDDQVFDAVRAEIEHKPQRVFVGPWRMPIMSKIVGFGLAAAAVVAVVLIGSQVIGSNPNGLGADPTPTATPEPTPTPVPSLAEPSSAPEGELPEGPLLVWESMHEDAPSITMTISAPGWIYVTLLPGSPATWLEKGEEVDNMPEALVLPESLPPGTDYWVYGDPCQWAGTRPETPATTVEETVAALAAQASRDASEPVDVTLGGYAGKMITLHVPADVDSADCDGGTFASYTIDDEEQWQWHQGPGQIDDFWFVDVEGSIVTIRASYRPDTPTELLTEMRTLVESATFEAP